MKYRSTRGGLENSSFTDVLLSGYCSDGGLFVPETIPQLSSECLKQWKLQPFTYIAFEVAKLFINNNEFSHDELQTLITESYGQFVDSKQVISFQKLNNSLVIAELFRGPSYSFKDIALSPCARLIDKHMKKQNKYATVLIGTSGDTGSACLQSCRGLKNIDMIVAYPFLNVNDFQRRQMTTIKGNNLLVFPVEGTSDDIDIVLKQVLMDQNQVTKHNLCSMNSINWIRILFQAAMYIFIYLQTADDENENVELVVPTGACGSIASGILCRLMGVPIRLIAAVNANTVVHDFVQTGVLTERPLIKTWANAMDICIPYNVERILYFISNGDVKYVKQVMNEFETTHTLRLSKNMHDLLTQTISTCVANDNDIEQTIQLCYQKYSYLICPHTATAVHYALINDDHPQKKRVCLATASPCKFKEVYDKLNIQDCTIQSNSEEEPFTIMWCRGSNWLELVNTAIQNEPLVYCTNIPDKTLTLS
ncbi:unnamed protein product [Didymodactylos carnosus]|uniref:Threonine synthase-like 2 n=1 Tax=Didymodactylos carnosus TaxID=1234261 RepID=A0A815BJQ2_9BILA|nr:unnamed protein product [Didymodactylos carnosus]CAF4061816.1 unnamed protein product [Didymodactylos carnosus]